MMVVDVYHIIPKSALDNTMKSIEFEVHNFHPSYRFCSEPQGSGVCKLWGIQRICMGEEHQRIIIFIIWLCWITNIHQKSCLFSLKMSGETKSRMTDSYTIPISVPISLEVLSPSSVENVTGIPDSFLSGKCSWKSCLLPQWKMSNEKHLSSLKGLCDPSQNPVRIETSLTFFCSSMCHTQYAWYFLSFAATHETAEAGLGPL